MNKIWERVAYVLIVILLVTTIMHYYSAENEIEEKEAETSIMGPYKEATENGFIMIYNKKEIEVIAPQHTPPVLGEVLVYGYLDQNKITAIGIHNYNYNYILYALSALAGLVVAFIFFKEWKITRRGIIDA